MMVAWSKVRRTIALVLVVAMAACLTAAGTPAHAVGSSITVTVRAKAGTYTVSPGSTFDVEVYLSGDGITLLNAATVELKYNPDVLQANTVTMGSLLPQPLNLPPDLSTPGKLILSQSSMSSDPANATAGGPGVFATITFLAKTEGTSTVEPYNWTGNAPPDGIDLLDYDANAIAYEKGPQAAFTVAGPDTSGPEIMPISPYSPDAPVTVGPRNIQVAVDLQDPSNVDVDSVQLAVKGPGESAYTVVPTSDYTLTEHDPTFFSIDYTMTGPLADGTYWVRVSARDNASPANTSSTEWSFEVSSAAPTTTMAVVPAQPDGEHGWYRSRPHVTLTPSPGEAAVKYVLVPSGATPQPGDFLDYPAAGIDVPDGRWSLYYFSLDVQTGVAESVRSADFLVDTQAPAVASVALTPDRGWLGIGGQVMVTVYAEGNEEGLTGSVEFNGSEIPLAPLGGGAYRAIYTVAGGAPNASNVNATGVVLRDEAGNASAPAQSTGSTLSIDASPPVITSLALNPSGATNASIVTVTGVVYDTTAPGGPPPVVFVAMDPPQEEWMPGEGDAATLSPAGEGCWTFSKDLSFPAGDAVPGEVPHVVVAVAADAGHNASEPRVEEIVHDTVAGLQVTGPAALLAAVDEQHPFYFNNGPGAVVTGRVEQGSVVQVKYLRLGAGGGLVNLVEVAPEADGDFTHELAFLSGTADGLYQLMVVATDPAGNHADVSFFICLDTTPPTISVSSPADGSLTSRESVLVQGTVVDANPDKVRITVGGAGPVEVAVNPDGSFASPALGISAQEGAQTTISVVAIDRAGNQSAAAQTTVTYTEQAIPLNVKLPDGTPLPDTYHTNASSIALVIDTGDITDAQVTVSVADAAPASLTRGADGKFQYTLNLIAPVAVTFQATREGLVTNTRTFYIDYDVTAPTFAVQAIQDGQPGPGLASVGDVTIVVMPYEPLQAAPVVTVTPAGGTATTVTMQAYEGGYRGTYRVTSDTPNGTATIGVSGTDLAGNTGTGSGSFAVDTLAPSFEVLAAPDPAKAGDVTITVIPSEALRQPPAVTVTPAGGTARTVSMAAHDGGYQGTFPVTDDTPDGDAVISVTGVDVAGNEGSASGQFAVDTVAPTFEVSAMPDPARAGAVTITVIPSEPLAEAPSVIVTPQQGQPTPVAMALHAGAYQGQFEVVEGTPNGVASVDVTGRDPAGNVGDGEGSFVIDTVAEIDSAFHDAFRVLGPGDTFQVFAVGEPDATVTAVVPGQGSPVSLRETPGSDGRSVYSSPVFTVSTGLNYAGPITVHMVDRAGNEAEAVTRDITIDTTPPQLTDAGLSDNLVRGDDVVTVFVRSNEPLSEAYFDAGNYASGEPMAYNRETGRWEGTLEAPQDVNLSLVVTVHGVDLAGNEAVATAGTLVVDNVPPPVDASRTGTRGLRGYYRSNVQVRIWSTEAGATVHYAVTLDPGPAEGNFTAVVTGPNDVTLTLAADGLFAVTYWAEDAAGNATSPLTLHARIDRTAPATPTLGLMAGDQQVGALTNANLVTAQVSAPDATQVRVEVNGDARGKRDVRDGSVSFPVALRPGDNTVRVWSIDQAGSESTSPAERTVTLDVTPPAFGITVSTPGNGGNGDLVITAVASEPLRADPSLSLRLGRGEGAVRYTLSLTGVDGQMYTFTHTLREGDAALAGVETSVRVSGVDLAGNAGTSTWAQALVIAGEDTVVGSDDASAAFSAGTLQDDASVKVDSVGPDELPPGDGDTPLGGVDVDTGGVSFNEGRYAVVTLRLPIPPGVDPQVFVAAARAMMVVGNKYVVLGEDDMARPPEFGVVQDEAGNWWLAITLYLRHFSTYAVLVDLTPPPVSITSPVEGAWASTATAVDLDGGASAVRVEGTSEPGAVVSASVNDNPVGVTATVGSDGAFSLDIPLLHEPWVGDAVNTITVTAVDGAGNNASDSVSVHYDVVPPVLTVNTPADGAVTNSASVAVTGTSDPHAAVTVSNSNTGISVTAGADAAGAFSLAVALGTGNNGLNVLTVTVADEAGNTTRASRTVTCDQQAPQITVSALPKVTASPTVSLSGSVSEHSTIAVTHNGTGVDSSKVHVSDLSWTVDPIRLVEGDNTFAIRARDRAGNVTTVTRSVRYDPQVPEILLDPVGTPTRQGSVRIEGTTKADAVVTVKVDDNVVATLDLSTSQTAFGVDVPLAEGPNEITIRSLDLGTSLSSETTLTVVRDSVGPRITIDPSTPATTSTASARIVGSVEDASPVDLSVYDPDGGTVQTLAGVTTFDVPVTLRSGANTFRLVFCDRAGNATSLDVAITYTPPYTPPYVPPVVTEGPKAEGRVSAGQAGVVRLPDGSVEVRLPAGAAGEEIVVRVSRPSGLPVPAVQYRVAGTAEVDARSATGQPVTSFAQDITLVFSYEALAGVDPEDLRLCYWDAPAGVWVPVPAVHDPARRTFTATIPHTTLFAVLADVSGVAAPTVSEAPGLLRGSRWLVKGTATADASVDIVVNGTRQATVRADAAGRFQARVTLAAGANRVYAVVTGAGVKRASCETYPRYRALAPADIKGHWAEGYVTELIDLNVVAGYEDETFRPQNDVTRAEFCVLMVKALGLDLDAGAADVFADAAAIPAWAKPYVGAAYKAEIVKGYDDRAFRALQNISRAEIATMVSRALALKGPIDTPKAAVTPFGDQSEIPAWAAAHVQAVAQYGIVVGDEHGNFAPAREATRAEAATMIVRFINLK
ncbi:MAG: S-layer homology domain-containing protein [Bacillota bacterium]